MSERGAELMKRALAQLEEASELLGRADDLDLQKPYADRGGDHAGNIVGTAALHFAEGYQKVGRLLQSAGYVAAFSPPGGRHDHGPDHDLRRTAILGKLARAKEPLGLLGSLTDEQLRSVPSAKSQWVTGHESLATVLETIVTHQEEHLMSLKDAMAAA